MELHELNSINKHLLPRNQLPEILVSGVELLSMGEYKDDLSKFIKILKQQPFNCFPAAAKKHLSEIFSYWYPELCSKNYDCICFVPGHPLRSIVETNLALYTASVLSNMLKVPCDKKILSKNKALMINWLKGQKSLTRDERLERQDKSIFKVSHRHNKWQDILLIDDICASGSSLNSCIQSLHAEGHRVRSALVLSRAQWR